jgi:hypothetical protein
MIEMNSPPDLNDTRISYVEHNCVSVRLVHKFVWFFDASK